MVAAIRSIDALIDLRTGDDKTAFLVIFLILQFGSRENVMQMIC